MFKSKYSVSILNPKWKPMKINLKLRIIPRQDEYIFFNEQYYEVLKVVHMLNKNQDIFVIVNELTNQPVK